MPAQANGYWQPKVAVSRVSSAFTGALLTCVMNTGRCGRIVYFTEVTRAIYLSRYICTQRY
jgi:hypothetical protein